MSSKWSRNYAATIRDRGLCMMLDGIISSLRTVNNVSTSGAVAILLQVGAEVLSEKPEYKTNGLGQMVEYQKVVREARDRELLIKQAREIWDQLGYDGLERAADALGKTADDLLHLISEKSQSAPSEFAKCKAWVLSMLRDGHEHKLDDLIVSAQMEGILPDRDDPRFDARYHQFKCAGNVLGVSGGRRGYWQLV